MLRFGVMYGHPGQGHGHGHGQGQPSIFLSASTVAEDAAFGTVVGVLSVLNSNDDYVYSVESDPDQIFDVVSNEIRVGSSAFGGLDYEDQTSHLLSISADNGSDPVLTQAFFITVTDVDDFPVNTVLPVITGTPIEEATLTVSDGTWEGEPEPTFSYQWMDDGVDIALATTPNINLAAAQIGGTITARVRGTNNAGFADAVAVGVGPVEAIPEPPEGSSTFFILGF